MLRGTVRPVSGVNTRIDTKNMLRKPPRAGTIVATGWAIYLPAVHFLRAREVSPLRTATLFISPLMRKRSVPDPVLVRIGTEPTTVTL
jgi:hypothetical protein